MRPWQLAKEARRLAEEKEAEARVRLEAVRDQLRNYLGR